MKRSEVSALRDSCMESIVAAMPMPGATGSTSQTDLDFVAFLTMVHSAACKQLDAMQSEAIMCEGAETIKQIAAGIEEALPANDPWANKIRFQMKRLRDVANIIAAK